ncbi:MAG: hypothetical protein IJ390_11425 [Lachnospiraceae bacterium]|nr:hypothetical protein [Lachnospiraceae bacterium]
MKTRSRTSLFLMELMLSILLFSLCSAVCVKLFVGAWQTEKKAQALTKAALITDSIAASIQQERCLPAETVKFYDSNFIPCDRPDAVWMLKIQDIPGKTVRQVKLTVTPIDSVDQNGTDILYALDAGY